MFIGLLSDITGPSLYSMLLFILQYQLSYSSCDPCISERNSINSSSELLNLAHTHQPVHSSSLSKQAERNRSSVNKSFTLAGGPTQTLTVCSSPCTEISHCKQRSLRMTCLKGQVREEVRGRQTGKHNDWRLNVD